MNRSNKSDIEQFFRLKVNQTGKRISGKCNLCPNIQIQGAKTSNYWNHLQKYHPNVFFSFKNNNSDGRNGQNQENSSTSDMENEESQANPTEVATLSRKRIRSDDSTCFPQGKLPFPSTFSSKIH